jgi:hypothetical protein
MDVHTGTIEEVSGDPAFVLRERTKAATSVDGVRSEPLLDGTMDDALEATAVDRELRHVVTGIDAAGFTPDFLTVAIKIVELIGADRDVVELLEQAEAGELAHGVRQRIDADAELADGI